MVWFQVRQERHHGMGGALTLAGRWQLDVPLGSCREAPDLFAEIQVQTPPHSFRRHTNHAAPPNIVPWCYSSYY
jgi:hypothetical protein